MDKKVLLIADDDPMNRLIISKFLKNEYTILEADNGRQALDVMKEEHVDALLLDIIMPEMDGLEVLKVMKEDAGFAHIGVLVATSTKEKTERSALSLGADDIVAKPYDPVVIKKRISNILVMKDVKAQKERLQNANMEEFLQIRKQAAMTGAESCITKIKKMTKMIEKNLDNTTLIMKITQDIDKEAESILDRINEVN